MSGESRGPVPVGAGTQEPRGRPAAVPAGPAPPPAQAPPRARSLVPEDERLAAEALKLRYIQPGQLEEARRTLDKFAALGLERRTLGDILLQRGDLSRVALRELYRRISPDVDLPRIDGYEVRAKIGEGGMGAVYEALQRTTGRVVALKVLHPTLASDEVYLKRFVREARTQSMLDHPNIVSCLDVGRSGGLHYFVMEYVEGPTVKELIREGERIAERPAFEIASQVARALECANRHGLVHRDIKPENILVAAGRQAKLCDLGLARLEGGSQDALTETGSTHGTPFYMSPEQAMGEPIDIKSDIYALGATLYEMVTGQRPFTGRTAAEVLVRQISEPPKPPRELFPALSAAADELIMAMLKKQPSERPGDPKALAVSLASVARGRDHTSGVSRRATAIASGIHAGARAIRSRMLVALLTLYAALATLVAALGSRGAGLSGVPEIALPRGLLPVPTLDARASDAEARAHYELVLAQERAYAAELAPESPAREARLAELLGRYREVVERHAATHAFWAHQARERIAVLEASDERRLREELDALRDRVRSALRAQRWRAAIYAIDSFEWPANWAAERRLLNEEVGDAAAARQAGAIEEATRLAQAQQLTDAIGLVERFCAAGPPVELAPSLSLLGLLRRDLAESARRTLEAFRASRDERVFQAYRQALPLAHGGRSEAATRQFLELAAGEPDAVHARSLRWLAALSERGGEVVVRATQALALAARERPRVTLAAGGGTIDGLLVAVVDGVVTLERDGTAIELRVGELSPSALIEWAQRAAEPPDEVAIAGFELVCGASSAAAHTRLARADHPWVELVERLRHHEAGLALLRYRQLVAQGDDGPRMLDCLDELVAVHGDLALLAADLPTLVTQRAQLRERASERKVEPKGKRTVVEGGWSLRYGFKDDGEREDWELGEGWSAVRGALEAGAGAPGVLRYRYAVRPDGAVVQLSLLLGSTGTAGFEVAWRQGERALVLELVRGAREAGELVLRWSGAGERALARIPLERVDRGQYNLKLWLERDSLSVELDGRSRLTAELTRPLEVGRLELRATGCPLQLRGCGLVARLLVVEEGR